MRHYIIMIALTILSTHHAVAQQSKKKDSVVVFQSSKVVLGKTGQRDVDTIKDPVRGGAVVRFVPVYAPMAVGGVAVHREEAPYEAGGRLQQKIAELLAQSTALQSLPDGRVQVRLRNVVISKQGKLAYYEQAGIRYTANGETRMLVDSILTGEMLAGAVASLSWRPDARYMLLHTDLSQSVFVIQGGRVMPAP